MDFQSLKLELQKRCLDLAQIKRPDARYGEALNQALSTYPCELWVSHINNTTLDTVADQRAYALTGLSSITAENPVRRVWIDDADGVPRETGRYEVQNNEGALTLVLDEPPDGAYDITIEYRTPPDVMSAPTDTTQADDDWLLAAAMLNMLGEADWAWTIEDPQRVISQLEYWNARAAMRARQLLSQRRRTGRRARTTAWRQYVT